MIYLIYSKKTVLFKVVKELFKDKIVIETAQLKFKCRTIQM